MCVTCGQWRNCRLFQPISRLEVMSASRRSLSFAKGSNLSCSNVNKRGNMIPLPWILYWISELVNNWREPTADQQRLANAMMDMLKEWRDSGGSFTESEQKAYLRIDEMIARYMD